MLLAGLMFCAAIVIPFWAGRTLVDALSTGQGARRLVETIVASLALVTVATIGLGATGCLHRDGQLVVLAGMAAAALAASRFARERRLPSDSAPMSDRDRRLETWLTRASLAFLALPLLDWYRVTMTGATTLSVDDSNYHCSTILVWLRQGYFSLLTMDVGCTFPFGAEMISLWLMIPFANQAPADMMTWTSVSALPWIALMGASLALIARHLGGRHVAWMLPMIIAAASWSTRASAATFSSVDNALPAAILAAIALFIATRAAEIVDSSEWFRRCLFIALALGLALGVKYSAVPLCGILGLLILVEAYRTGKCSRVISTTALFGAAALAIAGFWFIRNAVLIGNPFYPAKFLGLPHNGFIYMRTTLVEHIQRNGWQSVNEILYVYFNWPPAMGIAAVLGTLVGPWIALRTAPARRSVIWTLALLTWAMTAVTLALIPTQPWSAGCDWAMRFILSTNQRYIELLFVLGWMWLGIAIGCARGHQAARLAAAILLLAAFAIGDLSSKNHTAGKFVGVIGGAFALILLASPSWSTRTFALPIRQPAFAMPALLIAGLFAFWTIRHDAKRQAIERFTIGHETTAQSAEIIRILNDLPQGKVLCMYGRHVVLLAKPKHDPIFVGFATDEPVRIGKPGERAAPQPFKHEFTIDVRPHLDLADIVFAYEYGPTVEESAISLYNAAMADPRFVLIKRSKSAAIFVRKPADVAFNRD